MLLILANEAERLEFGALLHKYTAQRRHPHAALPVDQNIPDICPRQIMVRLHLPILDAHDAVARAHP
ncbi:MAG: hypothetical protein R3E96_01810 [Planctomycetota bacterium]